MSVIKVNSYSRGKTKVKAHVRNGNNISKEKRDCSIREVATKFNEIYKKTKITKIGSTGNPALDKIINTKAVNMLKSVAKHPKAKLLAKSYSFVEEGGAMAARIKAAYDEMCKSRK